MESWHENDFEGLVSEWKLAGGNCCEGCFVSRSGSNWNADKSLEPGHQCRWCLRLETEFVGETSEWTGWGVTLAECGDGEGHKREA